MRAQFFSLPLQKSGTTADTTIKSYTMTEITHTHIPTYFLRVKIIA